MRTFILFASMVLAIPVSAKTLWSDSKSTNPTNQTRIVKQGEDSWDLRSKRRVGIGFSAAGPLGFLGMNVEMNFSQKWGVVAGFGGGGGYQAFTFQAKRVLQGEWLAPYVLAGYSRWYSSRDNDIQRSTPSFLYDRFISDAEKAKGSFAEDLVFPGFGLQYYQLKGAWAGYSVFAEVVMLVDTDSFQTAPTGTLGMLYYF